MIDQQLQMKSLLSEIQDLFETPIVEIRKLGSFLNEQAMEEALVGNYQEAEQILKLAIRLAQQTDDPICLDNSCLNYINIIGIRGPDFYFKTNSIIQGLEKSLELSDNVKIFLNILEALQNNNPADVFGGLACYFLENKTLKVEDVPYKYSILIQKNLLLWQRFPIFHEKYQLSKRFLREIEANLVSLINLDNVIDSNLVSSRKFEYDWVVMALESIFSLSRIFDDLSLSSNFLIDIILLKFFLCSDKIIEIGTYLGKLKKADVEISNTCKLALNFINTFFSDEKEVMEATSIKFLPILRAKTHRLPLFKQILVMLNDIFSEKKEEIDLPIEEKSEGRIEA